jgi:hypothetical protein
LSARYASDDDLIADLARVAALDESTVLTRERYDEAGRFHSSTVVRRLGGWAKACERAGLGHGRPDLGHADDAWMQAIFDRWVALGRQPSYGDMRAARFSPEGYAKRFGGWGRALLAFQDWIDAGPRSDELDTESNGRVAAPKASARSASLRLRWKVLVRDRFSCVACGASPATTPETVLHVDHVVAFSQGGPTQLDNLQTLCDRCNLGKSDQANT